jgi:hypothetical protein
MMTMMTKRMMTWRMKLLIPIQHHTWNLSIEYFPLSMMLLVPVMLPILASSSHVFYVPIPCYVPSFVLSMQLDSNQSLGVLCLTKYNNVNVEVVVRVVIKLVDG